MTEKSPAEAGDTDLFGDPWTPPKDPRGRKAHVRKPQIAEKIAVLRATGATEEEIEARIGLSVKTIRKYYSRELDGGPQLIEALVNERMFAEAMKGKVGAARFVKEQLEKGRATVAGQRLRERAASGGDGGSAPAPAAPVAAGPVGKKEQRQAAANRVIESGGMFAPGAAPKLVVSNP